MLVFHWTIKIGNFTSSSFFPDKPRSQCFEVIARHAIRKKNKIDERGWEEKKTFLSIRAIIPLSFPVEYSCKTVC